MKMKIDFNKDEFGEIWLMNVDKLIVRQSRRVPNDNGTQLADYILNTMYQIQAKEQKTQKEKDKKEREMMRENSIVSSTKSSIAKRAKSVAQVVSEGVKTGASRRM